MKRRIWFIWNEIENQEKWKDITSRYTNSDISGCVKPAAPARPRRWTRLEAWAEILGEERRVRDAAWRAAAAAKVAMVASFAKDRWRDAERIQWNWERSRETQILIWIRISYKRRRLFLLYCFSLLSVFFFFHFFFQN